MPFSESLVQFFARREVNPPKYRLLNSTFNRALMLREIPYGVENIPVLLCRVTGPVPGE